MAIKSKQKQVSGISRFFGKAQGSLEYLLLIGGSVVVAVIVIYIAIGLAGSAGNTTSAIASYSELLVGSQVAGEVRWTVACATLVNSADWLAGNPNGEYPQGDDYAGEFKTRYNLEIAALAAPSPFEIPIPVGEMQTSMGCWVEEGVRGGLGKLVASGALGGDVFYVVNVNCADPDDSYYDSCTEDEKAAQTNPKTILLGGACDGFRFYTGKTEDKPITFTLTSLDGADWAVYTPSNLNPTAASTYSTGLTMESDSLEGGDATNNFIAQSIGGILAQQLSIDLENGVFGNGTWEPENDVARFCFVWYGQIPAVPA